MPTLTSNIAIIENNKILLTRRDDFDVWCLPGGRVEEGESPAEAAVREAKEEMGLEVKLEMLIGLYSKFNFIENSHCALFRALILGGELKKQESEVREIKWFDLHELPENLFFAHRERIEGALSGKAGFVKRQMLQNYEGKIHTRKELYDKRDQSGLSPRAFHRDYIKKFGPEINISEV